MVKVDPYGGWNGAIDDGVSGDEKLENILGSILDFPDFPMESIEGDGLAGEWDSSKSQYLGPIPMDVLMGAPTMAETKMDVGPPVFVRRPVSLIDTAPDTKQRTYRFEDTPGSCIRRQNKPFEAQETGPFQSQSPVSVLENSGSSLAAKTSLLKSHTTKRSRSKRARPSGVSPWLLISPFFSTSRKTTDAKKTKERRKKSPRRPLIKQTTTDDSTNTFSNHTESANGAQPRPTKKCTHCEITKTPQWREGPLGPKTLCNACGVRYRSGRLYPEYRPAASPTFVPSLHSNSHKKVIEMRSKGKNEEASTPIEFVPASGYLFDSVC